VSDDRFDIKQEDDEHRYRLILSGELDIASAPDLEAAITRLCTAGALEIELDLRELTFIDSSGIRALLGARDSCVEHHAEFFLLPSTDPDLQRVFELTRLLDTLPWRTPSARAAEDRGR
jgi:anti-anti-sigma factor